MRAEKNTWGLYMATFPHCRQPKIRHPHTRSDAPEVIKVAQRERRFAKDPELARPGAKWAQQRRRAPQPPKRIVMRGYLGDLSIAASRLARPVRAQQLARCRIS